MNRNYRGSHKPRGMFKKRRRSIWRKLIPFILGLAAVLSVRFAPQIQEYAPWLYEFIFHEQTIQLDEIPEYSGSPFVVINNNIPTFTQEEITTVPYESYSRRDILGRCGMAEACIDRSLMPVEEREDISEVHPSGWQVSRYEFIDGGYLYNRCHLIGFQLTGENDNEKNLITGTRYLNVEGMLPFENKVADYVRRTGMPVMYRVTPVYEGYDLVAKGVQMEAYSVFDMGMSVRFNVFIYNVQPGIEIEYSTGNNFAV